MNHLIILLCICENENNKKYNNNKGKNQENGFVKENKGKDNLSNSKQIQLNIKFLNFVKKNLTIALDEMIDS